MITIRDSLAGESVLFHLCESREDLRKAYNFAKSNKELALDTESSGINCYQPGWRLRTFQFGDAVQSFIIPAKFKNTILRILELPIKWIAHNGPHDIRSLDKHLGTETGVICQGETYLPAHHSDPRAATEGGVGHGLKEQATAHVAYDAGKWERALKDEFKKIEIPIPGETYKSGSRKGTQKLRKAKISEGYDLIHLRNPAYIAYAGSDTIITFRLWRFYQPIVKQFSDLYRFDHEVQLACDKLQRRALKLDIRYTEHYRTALRNKSGKYRSLALRLGCGNVYSGQQIAKALLSLGANLTERTSKGAFKTDNSVLKSFLHSENQAIARLVRYILIAKQLDKRATAYAEAMLNEMDEDGYIHPSINSIRARTARMSVSKPALQQLPTREGEQ